MCGRHGGGLVVSIFPFYLDESGSNNTPESLKKFCHVVWKDLNQTKSIHGWTYLKYKKAFLIGSKKLEQ